MTRLAGTVVLLAAAAVLLLYLLFPLYFAVVTSLKSGSDLFRPDYWPRAVVFDNYLQIGQQQSFLRAIVNSVIVAGSVVVLSLALGVGAAFAFARVRFFGRTSLLLAILAVSMFPQVAVLSGLFQVIGLLGLFDNLAGLILADMIFTLPFTVWVLTAFMRDLPVEIEEAAMLDGASPLVMIRRIFLPLLSPALGATALLAFIAAWNEFLFALSFTLTDSQRTVPVAIALISGGSSHELPWGVIMAASVVVTLPLIAVVVIFQRRLVAGLTAGAVKG